MTVINDGFVDYTLGKDYGDYKAGTTIRVDPERKDWLDEHGFGAIERRVQRKRRPVTDLPIPPVVEEIP